MPGGDSHYVEDWKAIAQKDWRRMLLLFDAVDYEGAAFFLQQSVEKFLKAWLLGHGWSLRRTHELPLLLREASGYTAGLAAHTEVCERLAGYYFSQRYPALIDTELSKTDVETDIRAATNLVAELFHDAISGIGT